MENELMSLGILFLFAIIGGVIAARLKQPVAIGLLLIGAIIGPNFLGIVKNQEMISMMAELGSILLLFVIGLEFVMSRLAKVGFKAFLIGILKIGIVMFLTFEAAIFAGVSQKAALIFGVMLSISSTVVIVKILESKGLYKRQEMPLLIGILLFEDLFAVIALTFLSGANGSSGIFTVFENLVVSMTMLLAYYLFVQKTAKIIIPWLLKNSGEEIITFIALGICAAFSYLAYHLGMSPAIGAFLAGSIVASLPEVKLFEHAIKPYTLTFSSLFFISVGTMVNFTVLKENYQIILTLLAVSILSRFIALGSTTYLFASFRKNQAMFSSIAMISVGEFSLLIAQAAGKLNLGFDFVSISAFIIFVTAVIMSVFISSYEKVTDLFSAGKSINHKPRSFANFMRSLMEEIDTENTYSFTLKTTIFNAITNGLFLLFVIITWSKVTNYITNSILKWAAHLFFFIGLLYFLILLYKKSKEVFSMLATIITNIYFYGNSKKSRALLKDLILVLCLFLITIYSPLLIVVMKMPAWINIASFALLIASLTRFRKVFTFVHLSTNNVGLFPKFKKYSEFKITMDKVKSVEYE